MSIPDQMAFLAGEWLGVNRLWQTPDAPAVVSEAEADVALAAQGKFLAVQYTWVYADVIQEGLLLIGCEPESGTASAAWVDAWHNGDRMMNCRGTLRPDGSILVAGTYPATGGPDWGWWIVLEALDENQFKMIMSNVPPGGEPVLAVEMSFERLE